MSTEEEQYFMDMDDGPPDHELEEPEDDTRQMKSVDEMVEDVEEEHIPADYTQDMLLCYLVSNPTLWIKCRPIVKTEYFEMEYRPVVRMIREHVEKYGDMPNAVMIHANTGVRLQEMSDANKDSRVEWFCDSMEEFCRTQAYTAHLIHAAETMEKDRSKDTLAGLRKEMEEVMQISLHRDLGLEIHDDARSVLAKAQADDGIPTGFRDLDHAFNGGVTRPSFNLVSAASGDGKSIFMQNIAINGAEAGENVIFYSLELEPQTIFKRFASMMTDTDINEIYRQLDTVAYTLKTRRKKDGMIWVKKFPMTGTTVADVASHYLELTMQTGLHFGLVCVDYIDVMYPINQQIDVGNLHQKDKAVAEELNDWTHKQKIICWSASQQTKGAQDEKDARQSGVAGGTPKINTCDNLIIGKRNEDDTEDERWWAHISKARASGGTRVKVPLRWDSKTQRMSDGDRDLYEETNPYMFGKKRQQAKKDVSERLAKDPIVGDMALPEEEKKLSGRQSGGVSVLQRLSKQVSMTEEEGNDGTA